MEAPTTEDTPPVPEAASARDWSELPLDALASVFSKLGAIEIFMGAGLVCRSWLQAAKLPDLWRSVNMERHEFVDEDLFSSWVEDPKINGEVLGAMAKAAVDRSGGQLEVFLGKRFVTDELLEYIGDRSPGLKAVRLVSCDRVSNKGFTELISKCPMIEDLHLILCRNVGGRDVFEATGNGCAQLKRLRLKREGWRFNFAMSVGEVLGVAAMHELRSLALWGTNVSNDDLASILDGCPHLENLDLRDSFNIDINDELRGMCAGIKSLTLPRYSKGEEEEDEMYELAALNSHDCDFCGDSD